MNQVISITVPSTVLQSTVLFYQQQTFNMKFAIVLLALVACAMAGPVPAALLKHEELHGDNTYTVEYHLDDGTVVHERGVKVAGPEGDVWNRSGSYRYVSPEGMSFQVTYTADEHGYQAHGDHLPKPVMPEH